VDGSVVRVTLSLIGPGILLIFGIAFAATWSVDRKRGYLLDLAAGCWLFTFGAASQILHLPSGAGPNAVASGALYTAAVLLTAQGLLRRAERPVPGWLLALLLAVFVALIAYYFYVDRNVLARVYIQNFGYGLVLLATALRARQWRQGRLVDRILFWILLVFALQFFPRTLLTIGFTAPVGARAFANSVFWQTLQLSLAVLGTGLALAMLAACAADIIEDLRRERDADGLTELLNRRAFQERVTACLRTMASAPVSRGGRAGGMPRRSPGALVLCDVDHFKAINDSHGHAAGDKVLRGIADVLRSTTRPTDIAGRLGGEEFGIFLPGAAVREACVFAARLKEEIAGCEFMLGGTRTFVTASFGVSDTQGGDTWEALYRRTDALLYDAKRNGRNRVVAHIDGGSAIRNALPPA
jgi:diguanylate cyclase (GGDEF)-like protein